MKNLIEEITLINTSDGHNKQWTGKLFEDGVITEWGKIDGPQSSKEFSGEGRKFYTKKIAEKLKKGYNLNG